MMEFGSFKDQASDFEVNYWSQRSDEERWKTTWSLFTEFHLSHGLKPEQLRLDRTAIEFGRK